MTSKMKWNYTTIKIISTKNELIMFIKDKIKQKVMYTYCNTNNHLNLNNLIN